MKLKNHFYPLIQKKLFPAPKIYIDGEDKVKVNPGSEENIIWVPNRKKLKHTCITLPNTLKGKKREAALRLKIMAWSPFKETQYCNQWKGNMASVFVWDANLVEKDIKENDVNPNSCEIIPGAFIRRPMVSGIRLVDSGSGKEGQIWDNGLLKVSRWWKEEPNQLEWTLFARNSGFISENNSFKVIQKDNADWLEVPWLRDNLGIGNLKYLLKNKIITTSLATILAFPLLFTLTQYVTYKVMTITTQNELSLIKEDTQNIRIQRRNAISNLSSIEQLISLNNHPHQIEILSSIHSQISPLGLSLITWDYAPGKLEFSFESNDKVNSISLIKDLEKDYLFHNVSASTRGTRQILKMNIKTKQEINR